MKKIFYIAAKELKAYFASPAAYIVLIVTVSIFNFFFFAIIDENREATLRDVFAVMHFMLITFVPVLTMKIFAEEKANGTLEFLMTTPTGNGAIVVGKYLGSLAFFTVLIAVTVVYYPIIAFFGLPDRLPVLTGYLGVWLEGAMYIAIGILASSWTKNQIVAAITAYVALFFIYFAPLLAKYVPAHFSGVLNYAAAVNHSQNSIVGILAVSDLIYYFSAILVCLALTRVSIENRL